MPHPVASKQDGKAKKEKKHLPQWRTIITPRIIVIILSVFTIIFIGLGVTFIIMTQNNYELVVRYDEICEKQPTCTIWFNITKDLEGTVALLYKLDGYYQNHRRVAESRSYGQLAGEYLTYKELSSCEPALTVDGSKDPSKMYLPCGLIAVDYFNDTYIWDDPNLTKIFSETNISLASDREHSFAPLNSRYFDGINYTFVVNNPHLTTDEHFIVWMRTAAMPTFLKLYSRCINCSIPKGNYSISVSPKYPNSVFSGPRSLVLSTTSAFGSGSYFLSVAYLTLGGLSFLFAVGFLVHMLACPRQFGDLSSIWVSQAKVMATAKPSTTSLQMTKSLRNIATTQHLSTTQIFQNEKLKEEDSQGGDISISLDYVNEEQSKGSCPETPKRTSRPNSRIDSSQIETDISTKESTETRSSSNGNEVPSDLQEHPLVQNVPPTSVDDIDAPHPSEEKTEEEDHQDGKSTRDNDQSEGEDEVEEQPRPPMKRQPSIITKMSSGSEDESSSDINHQQPLRPMKSSRITRKAQQKVPNIAISPDLKNDSDGSTEEFAISPHQHTGHFSSRSNSSVHPIEIDISKPPLSPRAREEQEMNDHKLKRQRKKRPIPHPKKSPKKKRISVPISSSSSSDHEDEATKQPLLVDADDHFSETMPDVPLQPRPVIKISSTDSFNLQNESELNDPN